MRTTTWHVDDLEASSDSSSDMQQQTTSGREYPTAKNQEGQQLLAQAAKRVWEELYISKKQVRVH